LLIAAGRENWFMRPIASVLLLLAAAGAPVRAQAPGVPVEKPGEATGSKEIIDKAGVLREAGKLVGSERIEQLLAKPVAEKVDLPAARTALMAPADLCELARRCRVRIGWYYLCHKCSHWHTRLSGGYPLTSGGVIATCYHVAKPEDDVKEGYLIVVDAGGAVTPVTSVIAASAELDLCILRADGGAFSPLPLNDAVRPGDAAYCLSDPLGLNGYFSDGMVNRFYRKPESKGTEDEALRLHVSTDWAPGSSGSPVLDRCGNVIGHVSCIHSMSAGEGKGPPSKGGTQIVLHEASPARGAIKLLAAAAESAAKAAAASVTDSTGR
jgi:Trypsin-like peptidase domain